MDKMSLKYEKITKDIIGGAFKVYNILGYGDWFTYQLWKGTG